jgi:hypothetical protein
VTARGLFPHPAAPADFSVVVARARQSQATTKWKKLPSASSQSRKDETDDRESKVEKVEGLRS